jgi:PPM family protein phosphatase
MPNNVALKFAARTDTGLVRSQNEDSIAISPSYGFAVLADGMGGYNAGEVASSIATKVVTQALEAGLDSLPLQQADPQLLQLAVDSFQRANTAILDAARAEPQYQGMGTTLVAALFRQDKVMIAHVGDSRAYRLRGNELVQLTRDHSLLQEQIDAGLITPEWARHSQHKNLVTRAVGVGADMDVEVHDHLAEADDIYLLCSDGLTDMVETDAMLATLSGHQASLDMMCDRLVQQANDNGGLDNISVVLIRVESMGGDSKGLLGRILNWVT